jgi:hypothetical protein
MIMFWGQISILQCLWKHCKCWMVYADQPVYKLIMKKLKKKQLVEADEGSPEVAFVQMKKTKMITCGSIEERRDTRKKKKADDETAERDNMQMQQLSWMA